MKKERIASEAGGPSSSTFRAGGGCRWRVRETVTSGRSPCATHTYMNVVLDTPVYRISVCIYVCIYATTTI